MFIEFDKEYLRELFEQGHTRDKKHRYQPEVIRGYYKCVILLKRSETIEELYRINSLNYEVLQGDKAGISSIRINRKYRLEFTVREVMNEQIITVCRLLEISNHYKQ
ncbi:type II toxin-antitoxin system RelE/ParE family toxin [Alistipes putredinis]|uniref:Plasmid maintenance system killer protein n=1 Tax=Myoviridae sp. ct7CH26 TaxID=2827604 RepID=A0A8S5RST1_9CAUD|nr:MAG TPA: Plasmid maintenance system killer protein [Myoviridae sp. ct7CH26]